MSGIYLEGDADFAAFEGQDVYVSGTITSVAPEILTVEVIEEVAVTGVVFEVRTMTSRTGPSITCATRVRARSTRSRAARAWT